MDQRQLVPGIEAQTRETLNNIEKALNDAGGTLEKIYEVRIILRKREHFPAVDRIMKERMPKRGFIAHAYEGVLLHPQMEIEIEATAYLGDVGTP
jgi:enamine deaminase RidA (YjgF/YER057c/UK114 family)